MYDKALVLYESIQHRLTMADVSQGERGALEDCRARLFSEPLIGKSGTWIAKKFREQLYWIALHGQQDTEEGKGYASVAHSLRRAIE